MSGLLVGILLSTSIAGLLSDLFHWKTIYALSSMALLVLGSYLKAQLPSMPRMRISYAAILNRWVCYCVRNRDWAYAP